MVDFRRFITALAALALFAGLAIAQNSGSTTPFTCATNVSSTPQIRGEGFTELVGDITLTCTGGLTPAANTNIPIPQVNITVFLSTQVTSRLLGTLAGGTASEALLLIDEPGSGLTPATGTGTTGFGAAAQQQVCPTPASGCTEFIASFPSNGVNTPIVAGLPVAVPSNVALPVGTNASPNNAFNVFQGVVSGNSVTWFGVPVLQPGTTGVTRTFRITNVRANATTAAGGAASAGSPIQASIAVSNPSTLPITQATPTVGFVQSGFSSVTAEKLPSSGSGAVFTQCSSVTKGFVSTLAFTEGFGTAFKTRLAANGQNSSGQILFGGANQNVPGTIYNSESGLLVSVPPFGANGGIAGLADFGTRLKATFSGVPLGVRLFVSVNNVINGVLPAPAPGGGGVGSNNTTSFAQLVVSENAVDNSFSVTNSGFLGSGVPGVAATDNAPGGLNLGIAEVVLTAGSGQAVWEVINTNPSALETFRFAVFTTFASNVPSNSPPQGTGTVALSFAPTPGVAPQFSASDAGKASGSLPIPRFSTGTGTTNVLNINVCRTILLYPFVTNIAGFDTGLAIANTSQDLFGTGVQTGSCTLNWFSGVGSPPPSPPITVAPGTVATALASVLVPNFQGYMIAVCQFQFAHGFAFISDLGAQKLAMGYLALVIPDPGPGLPGRSANPGATGGDGSGESVSH